MPSVLCFSVKGGHIVRPCTQVPALKRLLEEAHVKYEELKKEMSRAVAKEKQAMQVGGACTHGAHACEGPSTRCVQAS